MKQNKLIPKECEHTPEWLLRLIQDLNRKAFTGSIRINFHKGHASKKVEKTSFISE